MVKKDKRIKNLEKKLGSKVNKIILGVIPRRAVKEIQERKLRIVPCYTTNDKNGDHIKYKIISVKKDASIGKFYFDAPHRTIRF